MQFSEQTQQKIEQFAQEQSRRYLESAEMTYQEKLRAKAEKTKQKAARKFARFKANSPQAIEAKSDMALYMNDYMGDLISQGLSEEEAFAKAQEELAAPTDYDSQLDWHAQLHERYQERYQQYLENFNPADETAIGLCYAASILSALVGGGIFGYVSSGGRLEFLQGGWIDTVIGVGLGALIGVCLGLLCHMFYRIFRKK